MLPEQHNGQQHPFPLLPEQEANHDGGAEDAPGGVGSPSGGGGHQPEWQATSPNVALPWVELVDRGVPPELVVNAMVNWAVDSRYDMFGMSALDLLRYSRVYRCEDGRTIVCVEALLQHQVAVRPRAEGATSQLVASDVDANALGTQHMADWMAGGRPGLDDEDAVRLEDWRGKVGLKVVLRPGPAPGTLRFEHGFVEFLGDNGDHCHVELPFSLPPVPLACVWMARVAVGQMLLVNLLTVVDYVVQKQKRQQQLQQQQHLQLE